MADTTVDNVDLTTLQTSITTLQSQVTEMQTQIATLTTSVAALQAAGTGTATPPTITTAEILTALATLFGGTVPSVAAADTIRVITTVPTA